MPQPLPRPLRVARVQRGFTLIELLVSIAIMAVLAALTIPAVQAARRSAQAIQCRGNLAQLGEAFHAYHLSFGSLPPGSIDLRSPAVPGPDRFLWGWSLQLLPYLGENNQLLGLNRSEGVMSPENVGVLARTPRQMTCPASSVSQPFGYAGCHHHQAGEIVAGNSGVLTLNTRVRYSDLPDGLQNTILLGEALETRWAEGSYGSLRSVDNFAGDPGISVTHPNATRKRIAQVRQEIRKETADLEQARQDQLTQVLSDYPPPPPAAEVIREGEVPEEASEEPDYSMAMGLGEVTDPGQSATFGLDVSDSVGMDYEEDQVEVPGLNPDYPPPPPGTMKLAASNAFSFWPAHQDGGHFLFVDGSVRLVSRHTDQTILRRLANRLDTQDCGEF